MNCGRLRFDPLQLLDVVVPGICRGVHNGILDMMVPDPDTRSVSCYMNLYSQCWAFGINPDLVPGVIENIRTGQTDDIHCTSAFANPKYYDQNPCIFESVPEFHARMANPQNDPEDNAGIGAYKVKQAFDQVCRDADAAFQLLRYQILEQESIIFQVFHAQTRAQRGEQNIRISFRGHEIAYPIIPGATYLPSAPGYGRVKYTAEARAPIQIVEIPPKPKQTRKTRDPQRPRKFDMSRLRPK